MSTQAIVNQYIHDHIPITIALGSVVELATPQKVMVTAPFLNNINHKQTVFGGSLHAITTLACWGLLYTNFIESLGKIDIVISKSEIDYKLPIKSDFAAICERPDTLIWTKFEQMLARKGKGRICLEATITENGKIAVAYQGEFAVLKQVG